MIQIAIPVLWIDIHIKQQRALFSKVPYLASFEIVLTYLRKKEH